MTESSTLCVNGKRYFHRMAKKTLNIPLDLLGWLSTQESFPKCYWHGKDDLEIVALGSVLTLNEIPEFESGNDSKARFWGGHAFFPEKEAKDSTWNSFPRCAFFLPKYEILRKGAQIEVVTHSINAPIQEELEILPSYFSKNEVSLKGAIHLPQNEKWVELIQKTLQEIAEESFEKVVVARRSSHESHTPLHPFEMLSKMTAKGAIRFAFQFTNESTFIGATPERLYKREDRHLFTEAVAGTRKRGQDEAEDAALEQELLENPKERKEFNFVKTSIESGLSPLCISLSCQPEDDVIKTPNVQHLHNAFEGELKEGIGDHQILFALHPTAAMGGLPKREALDYLSQHEPFERGWYASPIGYISDHEAEFAVGIRSLLVEEKTVHFFAGTGIVAGSIPEKEWEELDHKTQLWKKICKVNT